MRLPKIWLLGFGLLAGVAVPLFFRERIAMPDALSRLEPTTLPTGLARATFGAGCYWCTEAVFQQLKGVQTVVSGYSGGSVRNPTYRQVCTGNTGHAEATESRILTAAERILDEQFEPSVHANCRYCSFHRLCPLQREGREVGDP